jgi:hypothetical protein
MTELKTLKDLDYANEYFIAIQCKNKEEYEDCKFWQKEAGLKDVRVVNVEDLRQEAIKHIKDLESKKEIMLNQVEIPVSVSMSYDRTIDWIKHFCNLEKED